MTDFIEAQVIKHIARKLGFSKQFLQPMPDELEARKIRFHQTTPNFQSVSRLSIKRHYRFIEVTHPTLGHLIGYDSLHTDIPKPRMWSKNGIYFCNYDFCEGRGTTRRGAWNDMWYKRLGAK